MVFSIKLDCLDQIVIELSTLTYLPTVFALIDGYDETLLKTLQKMDELTFISLHMKTPSSSKDHYKHGPSIQLSRTPSKLI